MKKKRKKTSREESDARLERAYRQAEKLREYATRRPGARERLEAIDRGDG